ncbi:MAG TPA: carbohydrate ABC transporter permease, partial [Candidatus Limnocylindrales bacterium]|nr:carbohydrate ABC transporter permease [Candidatus Limnocylindrales bacterium]
MNRAAWALTGFALLSIAPLIYMARVSLGAGNSLPIAPSDWWSGGLTLEHYRALGSGSGMGRFAINSLLVTGIAVPLQILLSAAAGHALARGRLRAKGVYLGLATAFLILPRQVTLVPLYLLFAKLGLLDTYAGLILPHLADPFGVLFMAHYYQTLSPELEEAARTDGFSPRAIFWKIILPLSGPG